MTTVTITELRTHLFIALESRIRLIDVATIRAFKVHGMLLAHEANGRMASEPTYARLARRHTILRMQDHHQTHAEFMAAVLQLQSVRCLIESLVWLYRTVDAHEMDATILRDAAGAWRDAIQARLGDRIETRHLVGLYAFLYDHHRDFQRIADEPEPILAVPPQFRAPFDAFVEALLDADASRAEEIVLDHLHNAAEIPQWWEEVVTPALHRIGRLWALAKIDVGQEHIASSIAHRVIAKAVPRLPRPLRRNTTCAVMVPPGELHELGASMVRDALELAGYNVLYTGANTPADTVVPLVTNNDVACVLVSTTLTKNLAGTAELIEALRREKPETPVVVGGQAYLADPDVWRQVGADVYETSLRNLFRRIEALTTRRSVAPTTGQAPALSDIDVSE